MVTYSPRPMSTVRSDSARVSSSASPLKTLLTASSRMSGKSGFSAVPTPPDVCVSALLRRHHDMVLVPPAFVVEYVSSALGRADVLLIGHLDTVFEADSPFQKFERLNERQARGPGIIDMKGGDVIIVQALKALQSAGALDRLHVTVFMTGDEESAGDPQDVARAALVAAAKGVDVAIGFEDGAGDPRTAVIGRRGTTAWTLTVTGKPAHSSQIFRPDIGYGAIFEAARILNAFRETLAGEPHLTFNPALVVGRSRSAR